MRQTAHPDWPTLRRHRIGIGLYDDGRRARLVRRERRRGRRPRRADRDPRARRRRGSPTCCCSTTTTSPTPRSGSTSARSRPRSTSLGRLDDSLARAAVLGRRVGHDPRRRDARDRLRRTSCCATSAPRPTRGASPRSRGSPRWPRTPTPRPPTAPRCRGRGSRGCARSLDAAEPGSDHQLTFVRHLAAAARSDEALDELEALLDGSLTIEGLDVDQDLRWVLLTGLARAGRVDEARDRRRARPRQHHLRPRARRRRAGRAADGRGQGGRLGGGARPGDAQRDLAVDRAVVHAARPDRGARAVRRAVPRRRRDAVGRPRPPQGVGRRWSTSSRKPLGSPELLDAGRRVAGDDDGRPGRASATSPRVGPTWSGPWPPRSATRQATDARGSAPRGGLGAGVLGELRDAAGQTADEVALGERRAHLQRWRARPRRRSACGVRPRR